MPGYRVLSYEERPELETRGDDLARYWPAFMFHDPVTARYYPGMFERYGRFQLYWLDEGDVTVACSNAVPLAWDGTLEGLPEGWDDALTRGVEGAAACIPPDTLCALQATATPGLGLGRGIIEAMRARAKDAGYRALIAPVRPTLKAAYPLIPMAVYMTWRRDDGSLFDPWMRRHEQAGGQLLKPAPRSMVITGSRSQWQEWTGVAFHTNGAYVVPGGLVPVVYDQRRDEGVYVEPNVWMLHPH